MSSPKGAVKRVPDAGVSPAVQGVLKNQKFKRMFVFGLRSLSDLCVPPTIKYKENSMAVIDQSALPALIEAIKTYAGDEEVASLTGKIFWGISENLYDEGDSLAKVLLANGFVEAVVSVINRGGMEERGIALYLDTLKNLHAAKISIEPSAIAAGLLNALTPKLGGVTALRITEMLHVVAKSQNGGSILGDLNAPEKIIQATQNRDPSVREHVDMAVAALNTLKEIAIAGKIDNKFLDNIITIIENNKGKKNVSDAGSSCLAAMVGPSELKACLETLKNAPAGSAERILALTTLSSMSYIGSYAVAVSKAGGIPLLCDAIRQATKDITGGSRDEKILKGLMGACKMLAKIAETPEGRAEILKNDGLAVCASAVNAAAKQWPKYAASAFDALTPLATAEAEAQKIESLECFKTFVAICGPEPSKIEFDKSGVECCAKASQHASLVPKLVGLGVCKSVSGLLNLCKDDLVWQKSCLVVLLHLARGSTSAEPFGDGVPGVAAIIGAASIDAEIASVATQVLAALVNIQGGRELIKTPAIVDGVLNVMLQLGETNTELNSNSKSILEQIASDEDVIRTLNNLGRSIMAAKSNPQNALRCLAAVNGLSQISRLRPAFAQKHAGKEVLKGLQQWIETPRFPDQQKLISVGVYCIETLTVSSSQAVDPSINALLECCLLAGMKGLCEKQQDPNDNSLLDICNAMERLCALDRLQSIDSVGGIVDNIMKVMRKFSDSRKCQVACMHALAHLALTGNGEGAKIVTESGAVKQVIQYMSKVAMYEDVQAAGLSLLLNVLKSNPLMLDAVKGCDAENAVKIANRAHSKSPLVRKYLVPLSALLVPEGEVERIINENMAAISRGMQTKDMKGVTTALKNIGNVTYSPETAKIAIRCNLAPLLNVVAGKMSDGFPPNDIAELQGSIAQCYKNVAQTKPGALHIAKHNGVDNLLNFFESINKNPQQKEATENVLRATRAILRADRASNDVAMKRGAVGKICIWATQNADNEGAYSAAAAALAGFQKRNEVVNVPEFKNWFSKLVEKMNNGTKPQRIHCVEALEEFMIDPDEHIVDCIVKNKGVEALLKFCDDFPDEPGLIKRAQRIIDQINNYQRTRDYFKKQGTPAMHAVGGVQKRVLKNCRLDADCEVVALRNLNNMYNKTDRPLLKEIDLIPEIEDIMTLYPDHPELIQQAGKFLGILGSDDIVRSLMKEILDAAKNKKPSHLKDITNLNNRLALFLAADVEDPKKAFEFAQPCMDVLAELANANKDNAPLLQSIGAVARRLADRGLRDPNYPYGAKILVTKMMPAFTNLMNEDGCNPTKRPRRLVIDAFNTLAACCHDPSTVRPTLAQGQKSGLIKNLGEMLAFYENDPEVVAAILNYMTNFAETPEGAKLLQAEYKPNKRNISSDLLADVTNMMLRHRTNATVVGAGMELIANLAANCKNLQPKLASPAFLNDLAKIGNTSPQALTAEMQVQKKLVGKIPPAESGAALKRALDMLTNLMADPTANEADIIALKAAICDLVEAMADAGLTDELKKRSAVDKLINFFENIPKSTEVMMRTCKALRKAAEKDPEIAAKIARQGFKTLLGEGLPELTSDPMAAMEALKLMKQVCQEEGNGRLLANTNGYKEALEAFQSLAADLPPAEAQEMKVLLDQLKKMVEDDDPGVLTLQEVYKKWKAKKDAGDKLNCAESTIVMQHFDFVANYTEEYSTQQHSGVDTSLGSEFMYGCMCFSLMHGLPENTRACVEVNEPKFMLTAITRQKNDLVAQCAIQDAADATMHNDAAQIWSSFPHCNAIVAEALTRGRKMKTKDDKEREGYLLPRMKLLENVAVQRMYFNGTDAMDGLIGVWDDFDSGKYSIVLLRQCFKSMRKIVNDHFVATILKNDVPRRLIEIVKDTKADPATLPDVLFLLGTLAVVPEIKNMIGELQGVEACLNLITRWLPKNQDEFQSPILTNACLALANMTIGHGPNIARFVNAKGLELNITAMEQAMQGKIDYDVANGASILMCNTSFKRDDIKEAFGKKGACQAIMKVIQKYDGSEDPKAFRCLGAMFKAIGNLGLYVPNVKIFLDLGIERTFADLYKKSEKVPDALIETSFKTISNLVLENTDEAMLKFGVLTPPILTMIAQDSRTTPSMFAYAFDVLASLCRHPTNSKQFLKLEGIPTVLKILNAYNDVPMYTYGIKVLGIQTTNPDSIPELIKHGVFTFLTSLMESQADAEEISVDLTVSGLRCTRRLIKGNHPAKACVQAGAVQAMMHLMKRGGDHPMIHMECHRDIIALLVQFPPPNPPPPKAKAGPVETDWDADIADEGVLPAIECLDRPPSPRSWESIGLRPADVCQMVECLTPLLMNPELSKQARLLKCALGLLAYFACEKIPDTIHSFYGANVGGALANVFEHCAGDATLLGSGCYVINNVAYASEPDLYLQLRRERNMRKWLDASTKNFPRDDPNNFKEFCNFTLRLLNEKSADPARFAQHCQWNYPLALTEWDRDKYPNGVQDLPHEMRDEIRTGGKWKCIVAGPQGPEPSTFFWKSSLDMKMIQFRISDDEGPMTFAIAVSRLTTIAKGLATQTLKDANEQGNHITKPKAAECMAIVGPPTEEHPKPIEMNLVCGRKRDEFYEMMTEWRDAATFGF